MAWGARVDATQLSVANTGAELEFDQQIDLLPTDSVQIQVKSTNAGSTDGLNINVYATLDTADTNWDTVPATSMQLTDASTTALVSLTMSGLVRLKVGVANAGSTDAHTADMSYRVGTP